MTNQDRPTNPVIIATFSALFTGGAVALLVIAHSQESPYVQGLFLNLGTGLVVVVPLALLGRLLVTRIEDLRERVSLREAADLARLGVAQRQLARSGKRVARIVDNRRQASEARQESWSEVAEAGGEGAWLALAEIAEKATEIAVDAGLVAQPWATGYEGGLIALGWHGESLDKLRNESKDNDASDNSEKFALCTPLVDVAAYLHRGDWIVAAPHEGPLQSSSWMRSSTDHDLPAWRQSFCVYRIGPRVSVLVGHEVVSESGSERLWIRRVDKDIREDDFSTAVGHLAQEWVDRAPNYLDELAVSTARWN